ncbi:MAG: sigma 54-interacting transcriptional regulator [Thermodesulfobacteriota bacterium]|nr:sigma 54-interacting transcriptional regulator [Thermodesulfobacteriota bacterium]
MEYVNNMSLSRKVQELTLLYEISQLLVSVPDSKKVLPNVLNTLHSIMGMKRGTITLLDPLTQELKIEAAHGLNDQEKERGHYEVGEGITGRVVETGKPIIVPCIGEEPLFLNRTKARREIEKKENISFICVPIMTGTIVYGALSVDRLFGDHISFEEDARLLTIIASNLAQAIKISRMMEDERNHLRDENITLKERLKDRYNSYNIVGSSNKMREVFMMIERVSGSDATVLIRGESGTGKELVANAIHYNSLRAEQPFIKVNCAALPETLMESELFGHEKGAFTGAIERRIGRFERAHGGTLFLDEIGSLNLNAQAKILRVLQERELERVGGDTNILVDVRIIAATNKLLEKALEEGNFREDLYYRLNIFPIYIPPLRERRTDILLLADYFLEVYSKKYNKDIRRISTPAIDMLMRYHWPGNVRELENCIERAVVLCTDHVIHSYYLPPTLQTSEASNTVASGSLHVAVATFEKELIIDALKTTSGHIAAAARLLGTTERIIGIRIKKYRINPKQYN